ncbi:hypothetical protein KIW84_055282 [Lathyrus oleraceus]|uniref:Uncharacterized protein n=1 Tax=Pisum sativum TaxID=3888 RepID=A0A9D4WVD4_PEA|nr:hypothetical protein KIW84_055282 [Pisum sativum]
MGIAGTTQLSRVKDLPVPEFGSLQAWEARASAANGENAGDSKMSHLGYNGAPMPYSGDTKVTLCYFKGVIVSSLQSIRN